MKINNKLVAVAVASALAAPASFAAQTADGMQYTSAAEGFYASIRIVYTSNDGTAGSDGSIGNNASRLGVQGSSDLGNMEGFYQYEAGVPSDNGGNVSTRLAYVGLRGNFGQIALGTLSPQGRGWVSGGTDIANFGSGHFHFVPHRSNGLFEYVSPDLEGFQASIVAASRGGADGNDIDGYLLAAKYERAGFIVGALYTQTPDALTYTRGSVVDNTAGDGRYQTEEVVDDLTVLAGRVGYSQDNWSVNAWYGLDNGGDRVFGDQLTNAADGADDTSTNRPLDDTTVFSVSGSVSVGQVDVFMVHESRTVSSAPPADNPAAAGAAVEVDDTATTFGANYNLSSQSLVWLEYLSRDTDGVDRDGRFAIGLHHSF